MASSIVIVKTNAAEIARDLDIGARELRLVLEGAFKEAGREIRKDYGRATSTWKHKPEIVAEVNTRSGKAELLAGTDDKIFNWVDAGTGLYGPAHSKYPIRPKKAKALRFLAGFRPKTMPNHLASGAGGSWPPILLRGLVMHPGIKPRRFTPKIQKRADKRTPHIMDKHMGRWLKRRGNK